MDKPDSLRVIPASHADGSCSACGNVAWKTIYFNSLFVRVCHQCAVKLRKGLR